jgi:glutamate/tyrosine decarboxylase-like PLP-dependent enzyme
MALPTEGSTATAVLAELDALRVDDAPVHGGRVLAYVYDSGVDGLDAAARTALAAFGEVNALDPTVFPSVGRIENDLVGWGLDLLGGPEGACGVVTSGGTESCLVAVLAARENWRARGGIGEPTLVMAVTAHAAFAKAAHLFGLRLHIVPVDPVTMRVRVEDVESALDEIGSAAAMVVVSAPSYAHGVVDPVREVAAVAAARGIPCHSDACIGGVVLPYLRRAGRDVPEFDLSVPGVRSLSVDLHKYGYAPKGVSLLLFSDAEYRQGAFFTYSQWPGYPVVNTTLQSTKSAGPMAAAWTVARILGDEGYAAAARDAVAATDRIVAAVDGIDGLRVLGFPDATLVALAAEGDAGSVDPLRLADRMRARGWFIQPQPASGDLPRNVHLTIQPSSLGTVAEFVEALERAADECRGLPPAAADPGLLAAAAELDVATLDLTTVAALLEFAGLARGGRPGLPEESADVQALLEALPGDVRDKLLAGFFSLLFTANR